MSVIDGSHLDEHEAFAASRVSQYVFCQTKDTFFNTLDQHADTGDNDSKLPLVVVGNEGSGKSALLANWVAKRREHLHRDEFLFQHFVGCTTPSLSLAHTLQRLETKLKEFYQLREMKVPDTEEDLRWSLGRFLANAAKKHSPARVIIIIDGVNRLKCEGMPDGVLHWVPTELPPCVRFILSTVELNAPHAGVSRQAGAGAGSHNHNNHNSNSNDVTLNGSSNLHDSDNSGNRNSNIHRSFTELIRRKCPLLRIEPLSQQIRNNVIHAFLTMAMNENTISLTDSQQFKIISAPATSQPMYLRSLLQGVRMCSQLTNSTIDQLLETFLHCSTAHELVDKNLNICCQAVFPDSGNPDLPEEKTKMEILGKIFTIVHVSRTGLTELEISGVIKMVTSIHIDQETFNRLIDILSEFTMVVDGMHSFSHEIYREVVYDKYVCSRDNLIRWHQLMARYFSQLETGPRKLVALPYHLEVSGSWSKVKNCLTDIKMFQLWWTRDFKADFIKTWAQLTKVTPKIKDNYGNTKKDNDNNSNNNNKRSETSTSTSRPTYDVVEEYVKSLDEYQTKEHPSAEEVSTIILLIADFLLEFATLGHEANADVPNIIHPYIPQEDLESIGVPHLRVDDAGRSILYYPDVYPHLGGVIANSDGGADASAPQDAAAKAIDDIPFCTTYFFHRWMWIQFPYIALGNCNTRFVEGEENKKKAYHGAAYMLKQAELKKKQELESKMTMSQSLDDNNKTMNEMDTKKFALPEIKFHRKAARTLRRIPKEGDAAADKFAVRMQALQDDIQNYREEYDFVMQMKAGLRKQLAELSGSLETLKRSAESVHQFDDAMIATKKRDVDAQLKYDSVKLLNKNLKKLNEMCDRHPPNVPALIQDIERKIAQDKFLLAECKTRLWEQRFERLMHHSNFKIMKFLSNKGEEMHNDLLEVRISMKVALTQQAKSMDKQKEKIAKLDKLKQKKLSGKLNDSLSATTSGIEGTEGSDSSILPGEQWAEMWEIITSRTGIAEPTVFFDRLRNSSNLAEQIRSLKKQAENKLENLKSEQIAVEEDMETTRLSTMNGAGEDTDKQQKVELFNKEKYLKIIKEKSESHEQLQTTVTGGLLHLGELLGIPVREDSNVPVTDLLRDIETMIDTLMDEREKHLQQTANANNTLNAPSAITPVNGGNGNGTGNTTQQLPTSPIVENNRPPELDLVLQRFESPKLRLPPKLPSRPNLDTNDPKKEIAEDEDDDEEGMWDRNFAMNQSSKFIKLKKMKESNSLAKTAPNAQSAGQATQKQ
jgi:hypothetical protein